MARRNIVGLCTSSTSCRENTMLLRKSAPSRRRCLQPRVVILLHLHRMQCVPAITGCTFRGIEVEFTSMKKLFSKRVPCVKTAFVTPIPRPSSRSTEPSFCSALSLRKRKKGLKLIQCLPPSASRRPHNMGVRFSSDSDIDLLTAGHQHHRQLSCSNSIGTAPVSG